MNGNRQTDATWPGNAVCGAQSPLCRNLLEKHPPVLQETQPKKHSAPSRRRQCVYPVCQELRPVTKGLQHCFCGSMLSAQCWLLAGVTWRFLGMATGA